MRRLTAENTTDMQALVATIHALPHLQTFYWIGNWPRLPQQVAGGKHLPR
jgi:hypothetical protein